MVLAWHPICEEAPLKSSKSGLWLIFSLLLAASSLMSAKSAVEEQPFRQWSLSKAVKVLNSSAWARQETFTTVVRGQGSGRSGEKEIYNTFYVRFLSARPIREAYARVQQIQHGYDELEEEERQRLDEVLDPILEMNAQKWVVVCVSFRSNDPNVESRVRRFFMSQTVDTLRDKAFLSTDRFSQVQIAAYFQPREESVGAKFVFPREIENTPLVSEKDRSVAFELLGVPAASPSLRAEFGVKPMVVEGRVIL